MLDWSNFEEERSWSSLAAIRLKTPAPWGPRPVLFVFIHFVLDLNREVNPYLSKYVIKACIHDLIWQAWGLFKSSWVEIRRLRGGKGGSRVRDLRLGLGNFLLVLGFILFSSFIILKIHFLKKMIKHPWKKPKVSFLLIISSFNRP